MATFSSRFPQALLLAAASLGLISFSVYAQSPIESLKSNFNNPPDAAKPMVRWWWFGTAVEKSEILRELEEMKADGIGGAELAFVYPQVLNDPAKNLINEPFVAPAMLDNVRYAQAEGRRLGLRIDVTLGSGWPYGGPAITLAEAAGRLRTAEVPVPANATSVTPPMLEEGESFISASLVNLLPTTTSAPCGFAYGNVCGGPAAPTVAGRNAPQQITWNPASAESLTLNGSTVAITPADKPRIALFFIASHTKQVVKRAAVSAEGWVLDPFSHQAVATHLKTVGEPLLKAFGPTPPYAIFSDSLEAYGADWTPTLPAEFLKRRGYDLLPHLPELVAGGTPAAEKVRHDWGVTLTELVNENYLTQINSWAIAHHTKFRSQTYGEPAVTFSSQNLAALPEGEGPQWRAFSTLRWATSANHVFGNNVTSGETFTWLHSPVFRATPLDMKAEADIDFIMGENQLIFHGWPYSPPDHKVPEPGWSLYAAAVFNDHNPWHPVMPDVTRYIQRISWLLRQGQPANQVAILLPTDDAWASFSPAHVTVTGAMQSRITPALMSAILNAGYNVDYIDADAINKVGLGTHQILVLPPTDRIPVETLKKIVAWSEKGGRVVAIGHTPTLDPEGNTSPEITELSKAIMLVPNTGELTKALGNVGNPDLKLSPGPRPNPADLAHRAMTTTPDLATMAVGDKEYILHNGSPDDATKMFDAIKGKSDTIPALVIESSPRVLKVAVSDDAAQNKTADFTFMMIPSDLGMAEWRNGAPATAVGQTVWLSGTYTSYTTSPFMVTMSDGVVLPSRTVPPPVHNTPPSLENSIGFIRRKLPDADIYFVANTSNQQVYLASATFGTSFKYGQAWDPDSALSFPATPISQAITLAPYESRVFVFSNSKTATPFTDCCPEGADISNDWKVTFTSTRETETEPTLTDWTADPATKHYSGEAVYSRDFTLAPVAASAQTFLKVDGGRPLPGAPNSPSEHPALGPNGLPDPRITRTGPGMHAYYDPPIHEAAIVFINGHRAGSLWHPPYLLDVSKLLKPGQNHIEIHVYNTALNAWSALPPHDYKPLIEKYGDRFQMQDLDKVQPIPSGILGTIHLVTEDSK